MQYQRKAFRCKFTKKMAFSQIKQHYFTFFCENRLNCVLLRSFFIILVSIFCLTRLNYVPYFIYPLLSTHETSITEYTNHF